MRLIHLVNRVDFRNAGDFACCLSNYLPLGDYSSVVHHDIDDIAWNYIHKDDIVIIGGGGMINVTEGFNRNIIRLTEVCDNLIAYSVGNNKTPGQEPPTDITPYLKNFKLVGIRDFNHPSGFEYVPCPSIFFLYNLSPLEFKRDIGVIHHRDYRFPGFEKYDSIDNSRSIWEILNFINSTKDTIVTSSYHCAYFSQALGKRVLVARTFSEKFDFFEHKPGFGTDLNLAVKAPEGFLQSCVDKNLDFAKRVGEFLGISLSSIGLQRNTVARMANLSWRTFTLEGRNARR